MNLDHKMVTEAAARAAEILNEMHYTTRCGDLVSSISDCEETS